MPGDKHTVPDPRLLETTRGSAENSPREFVDRGVVGFTVLWHPDMGRVGEEARLTSLEGTGGHLSRLTPLFATPGGEPHPLTDPHLSRKPLRLFPTASGGIRLEPGGTATEVAETPLTSPRAFSPQELETGVVLLLARRVVLLLHHLPSATERPPACAGLVGESEPILQLREQIQQIVDLDAPVLLHGESGTGKELVAQALHRGGRRAAGNLVAVNVGSLRLERAAADLFGAVKGAYTGAVGNQPGFFKTADGGTLFLDEIGEATPEVQVQLLRALENGEIIPLGATRPVPVDVRVISATDADLSLAIAEKTFRAPLYHRLATCQLELPPLRRRRADFGRLFLHFLHQELESIGKSGILRSSEEAKPWTSAHFIARLAAYNWPGNVRELRNVVHQLVVSNRGRETFSVPKRLEKLLAGRETFAAPPNQELGERSTPQSGQPEPGYRKRPEDLDEASVRQALRAVEWHIGRAAESLGIKASSLYNVMAKFSIRSARELLRDEIIKALEQTGGNVDEAARELEVSKRGLRLQMSRLKLR